MSGPRLGPLPNNPQPHTHIEGLREGLLATKDRVRDGDQSGAGPFLPRGEVISSVVFCLERQVSPETSAALLAQAPHLSQPTYLEGREAKACGPASGTKVEGSSHQAKDGSSSHHGPHARCHRRGLRGHHCPLQTRASGT